MRAQPAEAAEHLRPVLRFAPAFAFEADDAGQSGIAFEERREAGVNPPKNFRAAEMKLQQAQNRQRLDDIAQRAWFED